MAPPKVTDAIARQGVALVEPPKATVTYPGATGLFNITRWLKGTNAERMSTYRKIREGSYTGDLTWLFETACNYLVNRWGAYGGTTQASTHFPPGLFVPAGTWPMRRFHWSTLVPIIGEGRQATRLVFAPDYSGLTHDGGLIEEAQFLMRAAVTGDPYLTGDPLLTHGTLSDLTLCGYPGARWFTGTPPALRPWHIARHLFIGAKDIDFKFNLFRVGLEACRSDAVLLLHGATNCYVSDIDARGIGGYVITTAGSSTGPNGKSMSTVDLGPIAFSGSLASDLDQKAEVGAASGGKGLIGSTAPDSGPAGFKTVRPSNRVEETITVDGLHWQSSLPPTVLDQDSGAYFLGKPFGAGVARLLNSGGQAIRFRDITVEADTRLARMPPASDLSAAPAAFLPPALFLVQAGFIDPDKKELAGKEAIVDIDDVAGTVDVRDQVDIVRTEAITGVNPGPRVYLGTPWVEGAAFALRDMRPPPSAAMIRVPWDTVPTDRVGAVYSQVQGNQANGFVLNGMRISGRPTPLVLEQSDVTRFRPGDLVFVRQTGYRNFAPPVGAPPSPVVPPLSDAAFYPRGTDVVFSTSQGIRKPGLTATSATYLGVASPVADVSFAAGLDSGFLAVQQRVGLYHSTLAFATVGNEVLKDVLFLGSPYSTPTGKSLEIRQLQIGDLVVVERGVGDSAVSIPPTFEGVGEYFIRVVRGIDAIRRWVRLDAPLTVPATLSAAAVASARFKVMLAVARIPGWLKQKVVA